LCAPYNAPRPACQARVESAAFDHAVVDENEARNLIQAANALIQSVP